MNKYIAEFIGTFFLVLTCQAWQVQVDAKSRWTDGFGKNGVKIGNFR
jgi:glycerol uptake facilitator-like aquaporin